MEETNPQIVLRENASIATISDPVPEEPKKLTFLDEYLSLWILLAMLFGTLLGIYIPSFRDVLNSQKIDGQSLPVFIGLLLMLYPVFCKVKYEHLAALTSSKGYGKYLLVSLILNWIVCPMIMFGLAWATLFDLPDYRVGVLLIGVSRCIAMVLVWNELAGGSAEWCVVLVAINSLLQMLLFAPSAYLFTVVLGGSSSSAVEAWPVGKNVLVYLGIPFLAGYLTRTILRKVTKEGWYEQKFLPVIGPFALGGLLYTIFIMFAMQGKQIIEELGPVCRVIIPLFLYFVIVWFSTMYLCHALKFPFPIAVTQSFTAGSNNFELAMAVAVATFGIDSKQALATTVGPLFLKKIIFSLSQI
jgi:ACR3 family arsenite transporter